MYFGNSDTARIKSIDTSHGNLIPPHHRFVSGTAAMQKFWDAHLYLETKILKVETVELEQHVETAIEVEQCDVGGGLDKGKYIILCKRVGGIWKMHRDMWNSNLPLPE